MLFLLGGAGVAPALSVPLIPMVLWNMPRDSPDLYQTFLAISTWSWYDLLRYIIRGCMLMTTMLGRSTRSPSCECSPLAPCTSDVLTSPPSQPLVWEVQVASTLSFSRFAGLFTRVASFSVKHMHFSCGTKDFLTTF